MSNYWRRPRVTRDDLVIDDPLSLVQIIAICLGFLGLAAAAGVAIGAIAAFWMAVF
jgi:hypothetical protein